MIPSHAFANRDIGVFGLARSGGSTIRSLEAGGARVFCWDDDEAARRSCIHLGGHIVPFEEWHWADLAALVLSPGVPLSFPVPHPVVHAAREAGVQIIGDLDLFAREVRKDGRNLAPILGVTGTNGKSTTTALIAHILSSCGWSAQSGGNIGTPVLDLAPPSVRSAYALEVSSYQVDLSPSLLPDVAALTNISPDHLDRHGSMENYVAAKARLLEQVGQDGLMCIGVDDSYCAAIHSRLAARDGRRAIPVSVGKVLGRGVFVIEGILYDAQSGHRIRVMDLRSAPRLPGAHNWQNAAIAYAAASDLIDEHAAIAEAITTFRGLPHRIEEVGSLGNVRFINDSKATNADAAERALRCFQDIFWIAGGVSKEGGIEALHPVLGNVRKTYLIGEAARAFASTLGAQTYEICETLDVAVAAAIRDAQRSNAPSPVVLLSPACASFDQFRDYEHRGDVFRGLVADFAGEKMRAAS